MTIQDKVSAYTDFLLTKIKVAEKHGVKASESELHPDSKPHQKAIAIWGLELGAALIAPDCGTGKTNISIDVLSVLQKRFGGKCLVVTELGAHETYCSEDPEVGEGARMGIPVMFARTTEELLQLPADIVCTNYESVRIGKIDFNAFTAVWLDEGNYIKNMASETTDALHQQLKKVKYKYIASATPSPNDTLELVNYAHVLGIADRGQILTQFFQRNSTKAGDLTLHPQHEADFWLWVHSWMVAIEFPSDLGFSDEGYKLPELKVHWVEVKLDKALEAGTEKNGQAKLFIDTSNDIQVNSKLKQASIDVRLAKALNIMAKHPDDHFIIWHHLNNEKDAIDRVLKDTNYASLYGSLKEELREKIIVDFTKGDLKYLATKPEISGVGCNFQKHCSKAILLGVNNDFNLLYQMIKRIHRFGQEKEVEFWILYLPEEYSIVQNLKRKWKQHIEQRKWLRSLVQKHGLDHTAMVEERKRTFKVERKEFAGNGWKAVCTDAVYEWFNVPDNSIDLINSSFPFGNHYEYTNYYNDFGHNIDNKSFARQLDFLIPELLRTMKPGRIVAVHLKNRIHYGSVTGLGFSIFHRFTHLVCDAMEKHGFYTMGFHFVPTCVVGENNQTYRLTYGEMQKDATKMGAGIPEEIWLFRKAPTSNQNAYADEPVKHNHCRCSFCGHEDLLNEFKIEGSFLYKCDSCNQFLAEGELIVPKQFIYTCESCGFITEDGSLFKNVSEDEFIEMYGWEAYDSGAGSNQKRCSCCNQITDVRIRDEREYSLPHWQIDADAFWQTSGNSYITPHELKTWGLDKIRKWWDRFNPSHIYDYDKHVQLLKDLDEAGKLSRTFTTLPLVSNSPYIWNNVNRMHGLNLEQSRRKERNHICPQPYDEVDRIIELYSNPGDLVADPFGGLGTTGVRAIKKKRKAFLTELNDVYSKAEVYYLQQTEIKAAIPKLFDTINEAV